MKRKPKPLTHWGQYLAARTAAMSMLMFDAESNLRIAAELGRWMYRLDARHRRRAATHIALSFPHWSAEQVDRTTFRSFEHFLQLVVEVMHTPRLIGSDSWSKHLNLSELGPGIELMSTGRPVILVTGHLGNWEVLGYLLAVLGYPVHALARPLDNPYLNRWLLGIREKRGMSVITKWDATDRMLQVIQAGQALGFIADQNAGDRGMFVPFFGRLASSYKSIGLLAISQNVPIVCGYARRVEPGFSYELGVQEIIQPQDWADRPDPVYYVTARYVHAIEQMIRRAPHQYLWMHRRWKSRPRFEREGKPMPAGLRRNLESLPWMDQATMDRLLTPVTPAAG